MLCGTLGLFASIFWAGCTGNPASLIEPTKTNLTITTSTPTEISKPIATLSPAAIEDSPHVSPYIWVDVADVGIRFLNIDPVQVELVIRGTLPDMCTYQFYSVETRMNHNIRVSLQGIHPADTSCLQVTQNIEYVLLLGRDMPEIERGFPTGDYNLTVNNYQTSFSIK